MAQSADALSDIARSLQETIDQVTAREAALPKAAEPAEHVSAGARYVERLRELAARRQGLIPAAEAIAQRAAVTDEELHDCEAQLRDLAARTEALRQKLAQWAASAIR
jgi:hypothetical protein